MDMCSWSRARGDTQELPFSAATQPCDLAPDWSQSLRLLSAQSSVAASVMPEVMTTALAETDRGAISDAAIEHVLQLASKATVIAIGPGLSSSDERTRRFVHSIVKRRTTPVVIDADGLNCLAPWPADLRVRMISTDTHSSSGRDAASAWNN